MRRALFGAVLLALSLSAAAQSVPNPLICEDSIDGQPPFQATDIPCIVGCDCQIVTPTLSFLPGSINTTCYPYCNLDCVRKDATPAQSALAPSCWDICQAQNHGIPERLGWCMYWCVDGYTDLVTSTSCVPSLSPGAPTTTVVGGETVTFNPLTNPPAWQSWYQTQTVMPRTSIPVLPTPLSSTSDGSRSSMGIDLSTIPSTTGSKTDSAADFSSAAESDSASTSQVSNFKNEAVSALQARSLLLTSLSLYIGARIVCC
ncbi:hypothetical protein C8R45DRAFT_953146 [Mycena sanguinolenta]|nr:hypothetical protein C8R45DRAFT_953146 [Mycena sanguinolenta]